MTIVKRAAQDLTDILTATGSSVAIGVVPWDFRVRLDATMRTRWEDNSWTHYPTQRYYQNPYKASTQGEWQTNFPPPGPKPGMAVSTSAAISGDNPPGLSAALPATTPSETTSFVMASIHRCSRSTTTVLPTIGVITALWRMSVMAMTHTTPPSKRSVIATRLIGAIGLPSLNVGPFPAVRITPPQSCR